MTVFAKNRRPYTPFLLACHSKEAAGQKLNTSQRRKQMYEEVICQRTKKLREALTAHEQQKFIELAVCQWHTFSWGACDLKGVGTGARAPLPTKTRRRQNLVPRQKTYSRDMTHRPPNI